MANNAKIDEILGYLLAYPQAHDQETYFDSWAGALTTGDDPSRDPLTQLRSECGTTGCIAGWTIASIARRDETITAAADRCCREAGLAVDDIDAAAWHILGITSGIGYAIFYCFDNETAIARLKYVKDHPGATPGELIAACPEWD